MTGKLAARTVKGAVRNASGVLTEAIPYVGVAAMLAITAADLNDACDTMKDINALHDTIGLAPAEDNRVCGLSVPTRGLLVFSAQTDGSQSQYRRGREFVSH